MELSEMTRTSAKRMNKVLESRFGFAIDFNTLTVNKARKLQETITTSLRKIRHSTDFHTAEKNPRYMELLAVHESIGRWLDERRLLISEGEVGNAEVLLAAKDMVDSIQDTIEKVGKMQNEQLPQLLDSIRDQIGNEQAEVFKSSAGEALTTLMTQLQAAREGVDAGVRVLAGEQMPQPMDMGGEPAIAGAEELPPAPENALDQDEFAATDAAAGGAESMGRELR